MPPQLWSGNPLRWIPGPSQQSTLRRGDQIRPQPPPQRTAVAIPKTGSVASRGQRQMNTNPCSSPHEEHGEECPRMPPPGVSNTPPSAAPQAAQLNACPIMIPGSSAANGTRGHTRKEHHRESGNPDAPARCAGTTGLPEQPAAAKAAPDKRPRPIAPEGTRAAKCRCVLASSGSSAHRCPRLVWRPHVGCVKRATGIVALLPFHAPAVPFAAAVIPPHCPMPARAPPPAAPRGILRSRPAAPPQSAPAKSRAMFNNNQPINYQTKTV